MKLSLKMIYFAVLNGTVVLLTIISNDVQTILLKSFTYSPIRSTLWEILLVIALVSCLLGLVILFRQVGGLWKTTKSKVYVFLGGTLFAVSTVWVYLSLDALIYKL